MNAKAKGSRSERKAKNILRDLGYDLILKSGGSLGAFDLIGLSCEYDHCLLIQVKSNRKPSKSDLDILKAFIVPKFARKEIWIFKDRVAIPEIIEL